MTIEKTPPDATEAPTDESGPADARLAASLRREFAPLLDEVPGITSACAWSSALELEQVGGDFFDLVFLDSTTAMLLIGDAAGTGLAPAYLAQRVRAGVRLMAQEERSPARLLSRVNRMLSRTRAHEELVGVFLALVDLPSLKMTMSVAGHAEPLIQSDGKASRLESVNRSPLGAFYDTSYCEWCLQLHKGDRLVMYTDGITSRSPLCSCRHHSQ
jgi:serine phosphatase RsbU (regulator of sigma subunit)